MNRKQEIEMLARKLDTLHPLDEEYDKTYDRYFELRAIEDEEYKQENLPKLKKFYDEHIAGKQMSEIDPDDWSWYSDWHKDVFGYRPRSLNFGEYVPVG